MENSKIVLTVYWIFGQVAHLQEHWDYLAGKKVKKAQLEIITSKHLNQLTVANAKYNLQFQ